MLTNEYSKHSNATNSNLNKNRVADDITTKSHAFNKILK